MIEIWPQARTLANNIIAKFSGYQAESIPEHYQHNDVDFVWKNYVWTDAKFRRAHIEIVDATETKKMWVMHMCIFPHYNSPDPIFGFDIVCGKNKITGAFHDFSKVGDCNLYQDFQTRMSALAWNRPRQLPEWAQRIFSPAMLAVGNIQTQEELDQLIEVVLANVDVYLSQVGTVTEQDYREQHNHYCKNQKLNPHTPAMMVNFGVPADVFARFMDDVLFAESVDNNNDTVHNLLVRL